MKRRRYGVPGGAQAARAAVDARDVAAHCRRMAEHAAVSAGLAADAAWRGLWFAAALHVAALAVWAVLLLC